MLSKIIDKASPELHKKFTVFKTVYNVIINRSVSAGSEQTTAWWRRLIVLGIDNTVTLYLNGHMKDITKPRLPTSGTQSLLAVCR